LLHFCPIDPVGQTGSVPPSTVHFIEHKGVVDMSNESVHTMLEHSVPVSVTTVHAAPNGSLVRASAEGRAESGDDGGASPAQAHKATASAQRTAFTMLGLPPPGGHDVAASDLAIFERARAA
jgi:hypothetical protein